MRIGLAGTGRIGVPRGHPRLPGRGRRLVVSDVDPDRPRRRIRSPSAVSPDRHLRPPAWTPSSSPPRPRATRRSSAPASNAASRRSARSRSPRPGRDLDVVRFVEASDVPVHIGFQRRFDAGYRRAREAVARATSVRPHAPRDDERPASAAAGYIPTSGGFFRDCTSTTSTSSASSPATRSRSVFAVGGTKGEPFFGEGDVDAGAALLTLDDGTFACCRRPATTGRPRRPAGGARLPGLDRHRPRRLPRADVARGRGDLPRRAGRTTPSWTASSRPTAPS